MQSPGGHENAPAERDFDGRADDFSAKRLNPSCFACGEENPRGLRLAFHDAPGGGVRLEWTPEQHLESFRGVVHGGIVSTVLDEAMSHAVVASHWKALTAEIRVRFRHEVRPGEALEISAQVVERRKRKILVEATMKSADGEERAHAWGTFLLLPE